ncbi:MAG: 2-hydroxyacid dehydrogenase [Bryobacteraceae bacterium]|nr:2-hydroxyacid dehydrogenase [Bryobacteraceae bacterium]MDW8376532.1 2-hydroxyacid dehydrogenase [Bryobacterales bacterium]
MNRLLIFDNQWSRYAGQFQQTVTTPWEILSVGPSAIEDEISKADALVALKLPANLLPRAHRLKLFLYPGAGVVHESPAELPEGCALVNCFEHETPVAEFVMMAILMHATGVEEKAAAFRQGLWLGSGRVGGEPHREVQGSTLGLIGYGHIGRAVARRAEAFGMRVLALRSNQAERLPQVLSESDFLVIACPLTPDTRSLIGAEQLRQMKRTAYLVNVSRAEIVAEQALYEALRTGQIAGATLDVWYQYPSDGSNQGRGSCLPFHELPNVLPTPHMSAWTSGLIRRRIARMCESLDQFSRGEPLDRVVLRGAWRPQP